jgi:hypothetical protein
MCFAREARVKLVAVVGAIDDQILKPRFDHLGIMA